MYSRKQTRNEEDALAKIPTSLQALQFNNAGIAMHWSHEKVCDK